jgi:hypothetical protein
MPTKPIDRLLFAQGGLCFFCENRLSPADASVEHLVATANGGNNHPDNTVACCKALNSLLADMSLKEKLRVVLNQKGSFKCPNGRASRHVPSDENLSKVIADLRKRGAARPRTMKTLGSTIAALFQKTLTNSEVAALIAKLQAQGVISADGTKVSYEF